MRRGGGCLSLLLTVGLAAVVIQATGTNVEQYVKDLLTKVSPIQANHFVLGLHDTCNSGTGRPTRCQLELTNDTSSSGDFSWNATSDPSVAEFTPASGTITKGATSTITVIVPPGFCPVQLTFTGTAGGTASDNLNQTNGHLC